jgi:hypothetical protein
MPSFPKNKVPFSHHATKEPIIPTRGKATPLHHPPCPAFQKQSTRTFSHHATKEPIQSTRTFSHHATKEPIVSLAKENAQEEMLKTCAGILGQQKFKVENEYPSSVCCSCKVSSTRSTVASSTTSPTASVIRCKTFVKSD